MVKCRNKKVNLRWVNPLVTSSLHGHVAKVAEVGMDEGLEDPESFSGMLGD